ncbi:AEC family transporter [Algicella marina]|uniref:AEC family transporter n=1 Tax=Algicella marina TaxID=2683284 RepID=A0A6P1SZE3_9RHOB|nr:AEC family transporter [Algicella marina]QHQ34895.1 AEC family transporter [Algicella marina]
MLVLLDVVIPVFLVIGAGYLAVKAKFFADPHLDALMNFTQHIAIPVLLFRAALMLELGEVFDPRLLLSFYTGNTVAFFLGILAARLIFKRRPGEAVAIGFGALFSNSVILGVPIIERAYGGEVMDAAFAIIAIHAPFCYVLGITVMEISRADGRSAADTGKAVLHAVVRNALMIGLGLGFLGNFSGLVLPDTVMAAVDMIVRAALPTALFALGGVLTRYRMRASLGEAGMVALLSLVLHPAIAYVISHHFFDLELSFVRAAVLTASMAPGVNTYVFATLYHRAEDVAASTVLLATGVSVLSVSVWLTILNNLG